MVELVFYVWVAGLAIILATYDCLCDPDDAFDVSTANVFAATFSAGVLCVWSFMCAGLAVGILLHPIFASVAV